MQLDFIELIYNSGFAEKVVLFILFLLSVLSWVIIFYKIGQLKRSQNILVNFEESFWSGMDLGDLYRSIQDSSYASSGIENIFFTGFREFSKLSKTNNSNLDNIVSSVRRMMRIAITREEERLNKRITLLASIGSVSPYIGLFGTVIGVMSAFVSMGASDHVTLANIAPGIAQALIATAAGLLAAIPATWTYNHFSNKIDFLLSNYMNFSDEFVGVLNRKLCKTNLSGMKESQQSKSTLED